MEWEYKIRASKDKLVESVLNEMGLAGWELVSTSYRKIWDTSEEDASAGLLMIFKRNKTL